MRSVLLVHPDADRWLAALPDSVDVSTAATATEARAYLAGTAFDAVFVGADVEGLDAIRALRDVLGLSTPVESVASPEVLADALDGNGKGRGGGADAGRAALEEVRGELSRVAHALNNPLAVIDGNAQLGAEMASMIPTDGTIVEALVAIRDAAAELEALFSDVAALRRRVDRALEEAG